MTGRGLLNGFHIYASRSRNWVQQGAEVVEMVEWRPANLFWGSLDLLLLVFIDMGMADRMYKPGYLYAFEFEGVRGGEAKNVKMGTGEWGMDKTGS